MKTSSGTQPMNSDRLHALRSMRRQLLSAHDEYLASLRLLDRRAADEFVRSRKPLIEAMAIASDRVSAQAEVVRQFESAVA